MKGKFGLAVVVFVAGVVFMVLATGFVSRVSSPWSWFEQAQLQMSELPARIGEARRAGNVDLESRLIGKYNDSADLYNAKMRQAMLEYGPPPPGFVTQYSHWFTIPVPLCCEGKIRLKHNVAEAADGETGGPGFWWDALTVFGLIGSGILVYRLPKLLLLAIPTVVVTALIWLAAGQSESLKVIAAALATIAVALLAYLVLRAVRRGSPAVPDPRFDKLARQIALVADEFADTAAIGRLTVNRRGQIVYYGQMVADVNAEIFVPGDWQDEFNTLVARAAARREGALVARQWWG